jgi:arylsulfatase A-like enzyme
VDPDTLRSWLLGRGGPDDPEAVVAAYDEEILAADAAVGTLVAGLRRPSVVVVTSDHGEEFWDHGRFEHGHTLLGELTRVPLVVAGPGVPRLSVDTVVQHVDLFQGLLALAGATRPDGSVGRDLFSVAAVPPDVDSHAVSDNVLHGPPKAAIVDARYRFEIDLLRQQATLWRVDGEGQERERVEGDEAAREGARLSVILERVRGDLAPRRAAAGPSLPSAEHIDKLRALGYLAPR